MNFNRKKILFVTSAYPRFRGEERDMFIYQLTENISDEFDVFVLAPLDKNSLKNEIYGKVTVFRHLQFPFNLLTIAYGSGIIPNMKKNIFLYAVVPFYFLYQLFSIYKIIKEYKICFIHAHWLIPNAFSASLYKRIFNKKIKLLVTIHGSDITSFNNFIGKAIKSFTLRNTNKLTIVGKHLKKVLTEKYTWNKDIFVYPMGTDTSLFKPAAKTNKSENFNLLFVGRLIPEKGIHHLIDAMPKIKNEFPNIMLHIIGEGYKKSDIQKRVNKMNLSNNILFHGHIPYSELPNYYSTSDIFILPTFSEGFGLVLAEAMACGCIPLCSNIEPLSSIIENEQNGFLLSSISGNDIAKSVIKILNLAEADRNNLKAEARRNIIEKYDLKITVSNYKNLYTSLLNE